jgi:carbon storage regulator
MLVLSRKPRETILIGPDCAITVLAIHGNTVRIGIEAERSVTVLRGELVRVRPPAGAADPGSPRL